jgi:hypothetical protein
MENSGFSRCRPSISWLSGPEIFWRRRTNSGAIVARRLGLVRSDVSFELQDANVARRLRQRLSPAPQAHPAIIL